MSLVSLALRVAVARALVGQTFAEARVYDSAIAPLDGVIAEERRPFIVVCSDQERAKITGRDVPGPEREIDLVLELALASFVPGEAGVEVLIPHTDEGLEVALDLMVRQSLRALLSGESAWSRVILALVPRIMKLETQRGAGADKGVRFAARQVRLVCDPIADPPFGQPVPNGSPWSLWLAAAEADPATIPLRTLVTDAITGAALPNWETVRSELGLTREAARGIGIGPVGDLDEEPHALTGAMLTGAIQAEANEVTIEEQVPHGHP